jgi:AraC-like DNA-binding protein
MSSVPMVFARSVRKIADAAKSHGDIRILLRSAGLDRDVFDEPDLRIPYSDMMVLSEHAARMTKDAAFGLHVGEAEKPESYGIVGHSILTSSTLGEALRCQARYLPIWTNVGNFKLSVEPDVARFQWDYSAASLPECRHDCEISMATITQFVRLLTSPHWKPREVWFQHSKPKDTTEHARIFGAPIRFRAPTNALLFDSHLLSAPIRSANPYAHEVIAAAADELLERGSDAQCFSPIVLSLIRQKMSSEDFGLDTLSAHLGISRRTLQRRLSRESCSHRKLVQQAREELSRFLLSCTGVTTVEAAYALGFSEPSAFYHAFQEWFGISPRAYRRASSSIKDSGKDSRIDH